MNRYETINMKFKIEKLNKKTNLNLRSKKALILKILQSSKFEIDRIILPCMNYFSATSLGFQKKKTYS